MYLIHVPLYMLTQLSGERLPNRSFKFRVQLGEISVSEIIMWGLISVSEIIMWRHISYQLTSCKYIFMLISIHTLYISLVPRLTLHVNTIVTFEPV